jgi:S1-C subfamily serine protease
MSLRTLAAAGLLLVTVPLLAEDDGSLAPAVPRGTAPSRDRAAVERVWRKVARVVAQGRGPRLASAFPIGESRFLTAAHVVEGTSSVAVWLNDTRYPARVVWADRDADLAVLALQRRLALRPVRWTRGAAEPGEAVMILGFPGAEGVPERGKRGGPPSPVAATVEGVEPVPESRAGLWRMRLRCRVARGQSGSPVVRLRDGAVVGLVTSRALDEEVNLSYASLLDRVPAP